MRYSQNLSSMRNLRLTTKLISLNSKKSRRPWNSKTIMEKSTISLIKRMMKNQKPKNLNQKRKVSRKRRAKQGKSRDSGGVLAETTKQREKYLQLLQPFKSSGHLNLPRMMRKLRPPRRTKRRRGQRLWDQLPQQHNSRKTLRRQCSTAS